MNNDQKSAIKDWLSLAGAAAKFVVMVPVWIVRDVILPAVRGDKK